MNKISACLRPCGLLSPQRLNLDPAALEHYQGCLARALPLIDEGKVTEAIERMYVDMTGHSGTSKLTLFAVQQFCWDPELKNPKALRNFLDNLPYDPRALEEDKIIAELQKANLNQNKKD